MSFRARLIFFFVAIVVLPMVAVAVLVVRISEDSEQGKADARLAAGLQAADATYDRALRRAGREAEAIAERRNVPTALSRPNRSLLRRIAREAVNEAPIASVSFLGPDGDLLAGPVMADAIASERREVALAPGAEPIGAIEVAALDPEDYVAELAARPGAAAIVRAGERTLAGSLDVDPSGLPAAGEAATLDLGGDDRRAASIGLQGAPAETTLTLIVGQSDGFVASEPLVLGVLVAFLGLALILAVVLVRALQGQLAEMLSGARRIGGGDFSREVPVVGDDEFAGLAREFNKMSERLSDQMAELRRQREELDHSVRRIGAAFASGLDREALLGVVAETAVVACEAGAGRISLRGADAPAAAAGEVGDPKLSKALDRAAHDALDRRDLVEVDVDGARAIGHPLTEAGDPESVLGTMAVARHGRPFGSTESEVLRYLVGQVSVSVENVDLHDRVSEQALTDELTGLFNNRHLRDWLDRETARTERFGSELSLLLLDIDDFKQVNDTWGHLQGDEVLREIGRIIRLESRGIDEPARYGGEEFVLALPETPRAGAVEVAERLRKRIAATEIEGLDGNPTLRVTASLGVAAMPADGKDARSLIAAADAALYEAKRGGKDRVVAAGG